MPIAAKAALNRRLAATPACVSNPGTSAFDILAIQISVIGSPTKRNLATRQC
jgi:hypothetical protein